MFRGYKISLIFLLALLQPAPAGAIEMEASTGIFYFTNDSEKLAKAQTETAESSQAFVAPREARAVAKDLAIEELQHGNVCLTQAGRDLQLALKSKQLLRLCRKLFKEDLAAALHSIGNKLQPDSLRCEANVEARENTGVIRMVLSFRAQLLLKERLTASLKAAGFSERINGWELPTHEAPLGEAAQGWKQILKNGSCTLDEDSLTAFMDRYLGQIHDAKLLASCRNSQLIQADQLARLQRQFKEYVPDEWLKELGSKKFPALLQPPASADFFASVKECREGRAATAEQLENLRSASARIASKHDVPALDPENQPGARAPASEDWDH